MSLCDVMGVGVKSHSSTLIEAQADRLRRRAEREGLTRPEQPEEPKPVKKSAKKAVAAVADAPDTTGEAAPAPVKKAAAKKAAEPKVVESPVVAPVAVEPVAPGHGRLRRTQLQHLGLQQHLLQQGIHALA
ncbi:MAG TPA: hypothetical protein PLS72_18520, partial [Ilumatobacteraceae bacterium]|nr:hypothetical protein [Ilumatobacteraceae bacterium]